MVGVFTPQKLETIQMSALTPDPDAKCLPTPLHLEPSRNVRNLVNQLFFTGALRFSEPVAEVLAVIFIFIAENHKKR